MYRSAEPIDLNQTWGEIFEDGTSGFGSSWIATPVRPIVAFDFERRRTSVLLDKSGNRLLVTRGVPEDALRLSHPLDDTTNSRRLANRGFRVRGIASWQVSKAYVVIDDEADRVFAGYAAALASPNAALAALPPARHQDYHR